MIAIQKCTTEVSLLPIDSIMPRGTSKAFAADATFNIVKLANGGIVLNIESTMPEVISTIPITQYEKRTLATAHHPQF
jgi:hypothetical protein